MKVDALKINLIDWIVSLKDEDTLATIDQIRISQKSTWKDDLQDIERGLDDVKAGRHLSREEGMSRLRNKLLAAKVKVAL